MLSTLLPQQADSIWVGVFNYAVVDLVYWDESVFSYRRVPLRDFDSWACLRLNQVKVADELNVRFVKAGHPR
jgi:hypothetical protein